MQTIRKATSRHARRRTGDRGAIRRWMLIVAVIAAAAAAWLVVQRLDSIEGDPLQRIDDDHDEDSWSLIVLPDTQKYSEQFPGMFLMQTAWIAQNRDRYNIPFVCHVGDLVDANRPEQWRVAREAMAVLDGVVPYAMALGNKDYRVQDGVFTRETRVNEFFSFERLASQPSFGGAMQPGRLDNTFHRFEAGGEQWIVLALEWAPREEALDWANDVMARHPDHRGILVVHAYADQDGLRYDFQKHGTRQRYTPHAYTMPDTVNDGEQLWQKLVRRHNFAFVFSGHSLGDGASHIASTNDHGSTVHQIMANYQMRRLGGEGFLRRLEFHPDGATVTVRTYSPLYDAYLIDPEHHFQIVLD